MNDDIRELLRSLYAVNRQIPAVGLAILENTLPQSKYAEFGDLLVELGQLMHTCGEHLVIEAEWDSGQGSPVPTEETR